MSPRRNPETARVGPAFVRGVRAWIDKTFVPKDHYASAEKSLAHLRRIATDVDRLGESLLYTHGLLPGDHSAGEEIGDTIIDRLRSVTKMLATAIDYVSGGVESGHSRTDEAFRLRAARTATEAISKAGAVLSGPLLEDISSFLSDGESQDDYEPDAILLEYDIGRVKLIYRATAQADNRNPRGLGEYIPYFQQAKALLERRGFGSLWYGPVFVSCRDCGGESHSGSRIGAGGHYVPSADHVVAYVDPGPYVVYLLIHELGHRHYFMKMTRADRARFDAYFSDVNAVSSYGESSPAEDFAEVFAHFVLGRDLTRDQIERFKEFLAAKDRKRLRNPGHDRERVATAASSLGLLPSDHGKAYAFPFDYDALYHATPVSRVAAILRDGLLPRAERKIADHPEGVFMVGAAIDAWSLAYQLAKTQKRGAKTDFAILRISPTCVGLRTLHFDPQSVRERGTYTTAAVPPECIAVSEVIPAASLQSGRYRKAHTNRFYRF